MCIYMGVRKFGPFQFQKLGHSYTFSFKKGVLIIFFGALKKGLFGMHIRTLSYIGYPPLQGFKPFMVKDLLKRR